MSRKGKPIVFKLPDTAGSAPRASEQDAWQALVSV